MRVQQAARARTASIMCVRKLVAYTYTHTAGEHTNGQHPATATGAFYSGLREAQRIDAAADVDFSSVLR